MANILFFLFWLSLFGLSENIKNKNVIRSIDVTRNAVRIKHDISITDASSSYLFSIEPEYENKFSYIEASVKEGAVLKKLTIKRSMENPITFDINLGSQRSQDISLSIITVFTDLLEPKPSKIKQSEKQFVKFNWNSYFYSPYTTEREQTIISLPKGQVLSYSTGNFQTKAGVNELLIGPFENTPPLNRADIVVHFERNFPLLIISEMTRHIEISHWGNIAVEESFEIKNMGAALTGPFSRLDYDYGIGQQNSISSFTTLLPASAKNIYYRDEIGNISTSAVRQSLDSVEVILTPRFPLMGGWKTRYTFGYDVPSYEFLYRKGSHFKLSMRFLDHVYDDQIVKNMTVKIILPEMSTDIEFVPPYNVYEHSMGIHKTYLDTVGRPVIIAKAGNLVDSHVQDFLVSYNFNMIMMLREPFMLVIAFLCLFVLFLVYIRLDFSLSKDEKNELRLKVNAIVEEAQVYLAKRLNLYGNYDELLRKYASTKDSSQFTTERRKLEANHKSLNQQIEATQQKLIDLYPDGIDKLNQIQSLDNSIHTCNQESWQSIEKLMNGKMTKAQYQTFIEDVNSKKLGFIGQIHNLCEIL